MKKKIVAILLVLVIVLGAAMAFADEAQLRYIPCPVSGRHQMYGCGQGYMHPGAKGANEGTRTGPYNLYQCNQCGLFCFVLRGRRMADTLSAMLFVPREKLTAFTMLVFNHGGVL